jgi:hypothetical protein
MDLHQRKLTKDEWNSIEIPVSTQEKRIIGLITQGYHNVHIRQNKTNSLLSFLKIEYSETLENFVFMKYIQPRMNKMSQKYGFKFENVETKNCTLKKADKIRFANTDKQLSQRQETEELFEFVLLDLLENLYKYKSKKSDKWLKFYYTLKIIGNYNVNGKNKVLTDNIENLLNIVSNHVNIVKLVEMGQTLIERNNYLMKYADEELYEHQKQLFSLCKARNPKLIQYIAPTGTGKTMSPLGLSEKHRIIFVCAARHVGLALAKAAISGQKKIAFAFGCEDAEDIRLHYFAAKDYTVNRKSGGIWKVDNTVGDKVEIMICDIKSYLPAMYYMLAFNKKEDIILYWDEPTITLDYQEHEFHPIIQRNWQENEIPNVILSSATLPQMRELQPTNADFCARFLDAEVHTIVSHDCKKTIPLIDKDGYVSMPHYMTECYDEMLEIVRRCRENNTLLRYIDLGEAIRFVTHKSVSEAIRNERYTISQNFECVQDITMYKIKMYYLEVLRNIVPEKWIDLLRSIERNRVKHQVSNIHIVTSDAHTLTDGPTIFLAENVEKVARFCLQQANIPQEVSRDIMKAIQFNSVINGKVAVLQKTYEDGTREDEGKDKKLAEGRVNPEMRRVLNKINELNACVKSVELETRFIPNSVSHQKRFEIPDLQHIYGKPFMCDISENVVEQIMLIDDVEDSWKMLLLMGIGVFTQHTSVRYSEIMKTLAQEQKLYIIIASSDYIYGTNYQFCHGYISRDLSSMSQEKCIQAMGRVGRNNLQQHYSLRFRTNDLISKLFQEEKERPEVYNMERLFNS